MTRPVHPQLPYVPKLRRKFLKRGITMAINYNRKHDMTAPEALQWMLDGLNNGHYDWTPEQGTEVVRLDTNAVRQALKKSIRYCQSFPERVDALGQLERFRDLIDTDKFIPKHQEAVSGPKKVKVTQVDQNVLKASQIGVQRLSATSVSYGELVATHVTAGILTSDGYIDTDDIEPW